MYRNYMKKNSILNSSVMESGDHLKNGASLKSLMSRGNLIVSVVIILCIIGIVEPANAQEYLPVPYTGNSKNLIPIQKKDKSYAAIIKTPLSMKEIVDETTQFLAGYGLVDLKDVKLDEISDAQSEYTIPAVIQNSFAGIPAMMGARVMYPPVVLLGDLRFEFHENAVMIVFSNFTEMGFYLISDDKMSLSSRDKEKSSDLEEFRGHSAAALMEGTFVLKLLVLMNKGVEGYRDLRSQLDKYFADISEKYELFGKIENDGKGAWLQDEAFLQIAQNTKLYKGHEMVLNNLIKAYDEERLLAIPITRWENNIKPVMSNLFKYISFALDGEIDGVAEDGIQIYVNMDGYVLPVDPKWVNQTPPTNQRDRERYIKSNAKKEF